jgi:hypothetical protein
MDHRTVAPSCAPGWYPHPGGKPGNLYWDGSQWHTGIPATERTSTAAKLFWAAFAGFVVMKVPMWGGFEATRLGALLVIVGAVMWSGGLGGGATAAFFSWKDRREAARIARNSDLPTVGLTPLPQG